MSKIISANRLTDGIVVYLGPAGDWVPSLAQAAQYASEAETLAGLEVARADERRNLIIEPFAVEVALDGDGIVAKSLRNVIRATGPTVDYLAASKPIASERS